MVKTTPTKADLTETFTISFDVVKDDKARMDLTWENTRVSLKLEADATEQAMRNIKEAIAKGDGDFGCTTTAQASA